MEETFREGMARSPRAMSAERRLVYMAMTRARQRLYLSYRGRWPEALAGVVGMWMRWEQFNLPGSGFLRRHEASRKVNEEDRAYYHHRY
jgi:superfamily I DNA/RNA helicase